MKQHDVSTLLDTVVGVVTSTPGLKAQDEALLAEAIVRSAKAGDRGTLEAIFTAAMQVPRADQVVSRLADRVLGAVGWRDRRNGGEKAMSSKSSFTGYMNRFAACLAHADLLGANTALDNARRVAHAGYPSKWAQEGLSEVAHADVLLEKAGWEKAGWENAAKTAKKNGVKKVSVRYTLKPRSGMSPQQLADGIESWRQAVLSNKHLSLPPMKLEVLPDRVYLTESTSASDAKIMLLHAKHGNLNDLSNVWDKLEKYTGGSCPVSRVVVGAPINAEVTISKSSGHKKNGATSETAKLVANTILKQMGGLGRITAMTGAKNVVYGTDEGRDYVSFQFPNKMRAKPNFVKVLYHAGRDTYIVKFARLGKVDVTWGPEYTDVYAEQLKPLFERTTGLYLSL